MRVGSDTASGIATMTPQSPLSAVGFDFIDTNFLAVAGSS